MCWPLCAKFRVFPVTSASVWAHSEKVVVDNMNKVNKTLESYYSNISVQAGQTILKKP